MKSVLVDGLGIGDVGNVVLRDRNVLAREGVAIAIVQLDSSTQKVIDVLEIISRGFVFEGKSTGLLKDASLTLKDSLSRRHQMDAHIARDATVNFLERYFYEMTGRRPMILPVVVEV